MILLQIARPIRMPINSKLIGGSTVCPLNQYSLSDQLYSNMPNIGLNRFLISNQKNSFLTPPSSTPGSPINYILSGFQKLIPGFTILFKVSSNICSLLTSISKYKLPIPSLSISIILKLFYYLSCWNLFEILSNSDLLPESRIHGKEQSVNILSLSNGLF